MMQDFDKKHWTTPCPKIDCRKKACKCGLKYISLPAVLGDDSPDSDIAPKNGTYCNAIVEYEANGALYLYSSEGVPVNVTGANVEEIERKISRLTSALATEVQNREETDAALQVEIDTKQQEITQDNKLDADLVDDTTSANKFVTAEDLGTLSTAVQPEDIDYTLVSGLALDSNPSTTTLQLDASKVNISSGATSSENIPFTVASSTRAGIMNSATFNAVTDNTNNINALLNGAVAVTGLPATPTQAQLTTAWQTATGLSTLINRAQIYDATNSKAWTYYTNDATWHEAAAGGQITINTFTNLSEGTIKGSTNVGQVFAENDGTGSVNGWDALDARVTNNTNNMLRVGAVISEPTTIAYVNTANIYNGAVTKEKLDLSTLGGNYSLSEVDTGYTWVDGKTIYKKSIYCDQLPNSASKDFPHGITGLDTVVKAEGFTESSSDTVKRPLPYVGRSSHSENILLDISLTDVTIYCGTDRSALSGYVTIYYTKES